jgi:hypothetical protein
MRNAFDQAYDAYVARKQVERHMQLHQLREDLAASARVRALPHPALKRQLKGPRAQQTPQP